MIAAVLASKIYNENQLSYAEEHLKTLLKGLNVKIENIEITPNSRIQVALSGEDEKAALKLLEKEFGLSPTHVNDLKKFLSVKGYIASLEKSMEEVFIDIGVIHPKMLHAKLPLQRLQAQLADGRKIALRKIAELYGFSDNMPVTVKVTSLNGDNIEVELAEAQLTTYKRWIKSVLDRLLVIGASVQEVRNAVKYARCQNDIITIEPLGLFEHAVVCKIGTDAVGLIPKIGKELSNAMLSIFAPKRVLELLPNTIYC
jgi:hypothetical protein